MGTVLQFAPSDAEIAAAWEAFDAAKLKVIRLERDPASNPHEWFQAMVAEVNLYRKFYSIVVRAGLTE